MDFLRSTAGKIVSGLVALAVLAAAISWWRMDAATRGALVGGTGKIIAWAGLVLVVPWASFLLIGRVGRMHSNLAGGLLVGAYTVAEAGVLLWLFGWSVSGAVGWTFVAVGGLVAGAYNLFTCDWIAERME